MESAETKIRLTGKEEKHGCVRIPKERKEKRRGEKEQWDGKKKQRMGEKKRKRNEED